MHTGSTAPPGIPEEHRGIFDRIQQFAYIDGYRDGQIDVARRLVNQLGFLKFGARSSAVERAIESTCSYSRLVDLVMKIGTVSSWDDLLATN